MSCSSRRSRTRSRPRDFRRRDAAVSRGAGKVNTPAGITLLPPAPAGPVGLADFSVVLLARHKSLGNERAAAVDAVEAEEEATAAAAGGSLLLLLVVALLLLPSAPDPLPLRGSFITTVVAALSESGRRPAPVPARTPLIRCCFACIYGYCTRVSESAPTCARQS
eukprot:COSAG05_NODE_598_length_8448_cov_204.560786_3_plen_165_part_00